MSLDQTIAEIQAATAELKEANDYAEWLAEQKAKLDRALAMNADIYKRSRSASVVRDYTNDTISLAR